MSETTPLATQDYARSGEYPRAGAVGRDGLRVEPPVSGSRRRLPELILGILLIAGCALAAVLLAVSGRSRIPAVALSDDVERGDVIERADLTTVQLGTDGDVSYLRQSDLDTLVGQVALTDLPGGAVVTPDMFGAPAEQLGSGDGRIGLTADMHQMPSLGLAVGDEVSVVARPQGSGEAASIVGQAVVSHIEKLEERSGQDDRWYVSLQAPRTQADAMAIALAGDSQVELVQVGG